MMTAGQFFLYLLIIIILKESLASAANPPDLEQPPSTISCCGDSVSASQTDDGSSKENMGVPHGFPLQAQPDSRFVRGKLDGVAHFRISSVGQHVAHSTR